MKLGASREEVAGDLARALLAEGEQQRVIDLVGDVGQGPQPRRLLLALGKAEAALALPGYESREVTKSFVSVFRLRSTAQADGAIVDLPWLDRHVADLRAKNPAVEGGYQHFACEREPAPIAASQGGTPNGRRVLKVGPHHPLRRASDGRRVAQDSAITDLEGGRSVGDVALWKQSGLLWRGVNGRPHLDSQGRTGQE